MSANHIYVTFVLQCSKYCCGPIYHPNHSANRVKKISGIYSQKVRKPVWRLVPVLNTHLEELSCLLVGKTSRLGVVLRDRDGSDSPNS